MEHKVLCDYYLNKIKIYVNTNRYRKDKLWGKSL